ncbi:hypothetical protein [Rhodococcoides fascians]|uniref:hypothetical protein n=1 Tax=Rhodococcoides fascians TaxID=1828 RepID=UPI002784F571|nr:hypothetical protein [Rhodococcus fascians]MDQ0283764.1 hypothetical protein [Rhodococcus fascians]
MSTFDESVIYKPGERRDDNDDPIAGSSIPVAVPGCVIEPLGSTEAPERGRNGRVTRMRIIITEKPPVPILNTGTIIVRGVEFEIDGDVAENIDDEDPEDCSWVVELMKAVG